MADCVACGTRVDEGVTHCGSCGADLRRPGTLQQFTGWVFFFISTIPLCVGGIAAQQRNFIPLGIGLGLLLTGIILIFAGRARLRGSPDPLKPSAAPTGATTAT